MNSLLKHQVKKYLSSKNVSNEDLMAFIDAVNRSYDNFDEQYLLQQRAMLISSEELSDSNKRLQNESKIQSNLIDKLNNVIESLKIHEMPGHKNAGTSNMDGLKLAEFIDKQTNEIIEMNKQREKLLKELESQNQELSDYAYLVSHDLKSPLRSIDTLTAWINQEAEEKNTENTSEKLKLIRDNVEKMDNLIGGILNYSTINKNEHQTGDIDVNIVLKEVLSSISLPENISVNLPSDFPIVKADKPRLKELFLNLIDNAIKFNDKENGVVEIGFEDESNSWKFYVKDNGKGIERAYFDKIFKPFQKLSSSSNSIGMGLSLAKKIVLAYKGKLWLESELGRGSVFYFTIPK